MAGVVVESNADERAGGLGGFFNKAGDLTGGIDVHDAVFTGLIQAAHIIDPQHRTGLGAAIITKTPEALVEEVVTGHHDQIVVELFLFEHQIQVSDGPQFVGIIGRTVVDDRKTEGVLSGFQIGLRPLREVARELGIGVGVSSGANLLGALKIQQTMGPQAVVCTILCDDNKKYLSTDLCRDEPIREGYLSPDIELLGMACVSCDGLARTVPA